MDQERITETRFPTQHTKFASALLVCGFKLKQTDPFTVTRAPGERGRKEGFVTTIWFTPSSNGMLARDLWKGWETRTVPYLTWMRSAMEKRDWILKIVKPGKVLSTIPSEFLATDDLFTASILAARDIYLYGYNDQRFYFSKQGESIVDEIRMDDNELQERGLLEKETSWMLKGLRQQMILVKCIREVMADISQTIIANKRGDTATIPVKASTTHSRMLMRELMRMQEEPR